MYQVTTDAFARIVGAENCEPSNIYVAATVDQGGNMSNAFGNMGVPVLICSGHRLNSAVSRATGITRSFNKDGSGTCKNRPCKELVTNSQNIPIHNITQSLPVYITKLWDGASFTTL